MLSLKVHVVSIYFNCFRSFRGTLQLFHIDITKIDWDVAFVVMAICFRRILQVFLFGYCICFIPQVFLYGCCVCFEMTFQVFSRCFLNVSNAYFNCFICFQTLVASVSSRCFKSKSGVTHVYNMSHLPHPPAIAVRASSMCVGSGGMSTTRLWAQKAKGEVRGATRVIPT
jgi:hypothetical protein